MYFFCNKRNEFITWFCCRKYYGVKDNRLGADGVFTNKRIEIQLVLYLWRKRQYKVICNHLSKFVWAIVTIVYC